MTRRSKRLILPDMRQLNRHELAAVQTLLQTAQQVAYWEATRQGYEGSGDALSRMLGDRAAATRDHHAKDLRSFLRAWQQGHEEGN